VKAKSLGMIALLIVTLTACDHTPTPSNPSTPDPMSAFTGAWHSTSTGGACSSTTWSVVQTGAATATITYVATCAGLPITGTATGTLNGIATLNWSTTGTAATNCAYTINGTAVPGTTASDLNVTYTGNVCGTAVNGADTLHR
jgi:hypothetical protein